MYQEHSFKTFLECLPDASIILNSEGNIVLVNAQSETLFQYKKDELTGRNIEILIPSPHFNSHIRPRDEFPAVPNIHSMSDPKIPLSGARKNGEQFAVEVRLSPLQTAADELFIFLSVRDITYRIKIEEELKEAKSLFQRIVETSIQGIIKLETVYDSTGAVADFRYILINKRGAELLGYNKEAITGKKLSEVIPDFINSERFEILHRVFTTGNTETTEILQSVREVRRWFKTSWVKTTRGIILTFDDITPIKESQKKLEELNAELEKRVNERTLELSSANERLQNINNKLDRYAYMISHDLKAPLANIEGLADLVKSDYNEKPVDEEGQALLDMMKAKVQDMRDIIDSVLQSAKDETKNKEEVNIQQVAHEVIETLAPPARFHIFIQSYLPRIRYHRTSLKQILQNLLSNAIKYMDKEQPLITISCSETGDYYVICVTDNGPGIPREKQKDIFKLFETANEDSREDSYGIGLTIVKQLVEENGGKIWVESEPGKDTKFHFTIPKK